MFRNHWSVENGLHHVKDRGWDEDVHTLRRPGLGEVYATLVNTGLNALRLEGWFPPPPDVHAPASQDLRLQPNADHQPPLRTRFLTLQSSWHLLGAPFISAHFPSFLSVWTCRQGWACSGFQGWDAKLFRRRSGPGPGGNASLAVTTVGRRDKAWQGRGVRAMAGRRMALVSQGRLPAVWARCGFPLAGVWGQWGCGMAARPAKAEWRGRTTG